MSDFERSIFPIVQQQKNGRPKLIGSGFFILPWGLFVTAKHIFEGKDIDEEDAFDAFVTVDGALVQLPIEEINLSSDRDIAFGVIQMQSAASIVSVMQDDPIVSEHGNEVLGALVFAQTLIHEKIPFDPDEVIFNVRSLWEKGYVEDIHPDGLRYVPGRCYSTSLFAEGRSSGSPVFNSNGFVIGLISTGIAPSGLCPFSTITAISEVLSFPVNGETLWEHRKKLPNKPTVRVRRQG